MYFYIIKTIIMELIFNYLKSYIVYDGDISLNQGTTINLICGIKYMIVKHFGNDFTIDIGYIFHHADDKSYFFRNFNNIIPYCIDINDKNTYFYQLADDFTLTYIEDIFLTFYTSKQTITSKNIYVTKLLGVIYIYNDRKYGYLYNTIQNNYILLKNMHYNLKLISMN